MTPPAWLVFLQRTYPSANSVLVRTAHPVLFDTGFGSDFSATERLVREAGVAPEDLTLIVNSHYHSDHVGGNHGFQRYGVPIAAHRWEAALVNRRDREACTADWLDQPVEPYRVDVSLSDLDEIDAGGVTLRVLHTPGHSQGHLSLYAPDDGVLIVGDVFHGDDVAWINPFREGVTSLDRALETLDRLARLPLRYACSGHGAAMTDPLAAIDAARRRYEGWLTRLESVAWHGAKRIFAFHLMLKDGLAEADVAPYLQGCPWFQDYSRHVFGLAPADFVAPFLAEMQRSGAAEWRAGRLVALTPYIPPPPGWPAGPYRPQDWPT